MPIDVSVRATEHAAFAKAVKRQATCGSTTLAVSEHYTIPALLPALGLNWTFSRQYEKWSARCDAAGWPEPDDGMAESKCYDYALVITLLSSWQTWQTTPYRLWNAVGLQSMHERGSAAWLPARARRGWRRPGPVGLGTEPPPPPVRQPPPLHLGTQARQPRPLQHLRPRRPPPARRSSPRPPPRRKFGRFQSAACWGCWRWWQPASVGMPLLAAESNKGGPRRGKLEGAASDGQAQCSVGIEWPPAHWWSAMQLRQCGVGLGLAGAYALFVP
jgi:hypothetical protein